MTAKLYASAQLPDRWIAEDDSGALVQWPALVGGWAQRTVYRGQRRALSEVDTRNAYGTGWPGARGRGRPPRTGAATATNVRATDDERAAWERCAGDEPLSVWLRDLANLAALQRAVKR